MGQSADKVFINGKIYSMDKWNTTYEAMAVKNGKITFLGTMKECELWVDQKTEVIELKGRVMLPAFSDSHVHAPGLAYDFLFNINLYEALSAEETLDSIKTFIDLHPNLEIYYGRGFNSSFFKGTESIKGPRKEHLDRICTEKPIILSDFGGNYLWMNSKAFEKYQITNATKAPEGGMIELDEETGELWGVVREGARVLVPYQTFTKEQNYQAARWFQKVMNSYGYTSIFALRPPGTVEPRTTLFDLFKELEERGELTMCVQGARDMDQTADIDVQIKEMKRLKSLYDSERIRFTTAKFFIDGVIESATGCLLEPYEEAADKGADYKGAVIWSHDKLSFAFQRCMEEGFQIYCHTIGDGATRKALDALETAFKNMGTKESSIRKYRNTFTHLQLVSGSDVNRMVRLNVIAGVQPYWHFKSPIMWWSVEHPLLGERAEHQYPLASFVKAGVVLVASSDYPVTPDPNPFYAIQAGTTRNIYHAESYHLEDIGDMDDPEYLLDKEERISVSDMIKAFTLNAAYARYRENEEGSLETGKTADFIIIDKNPFEIGLLELQSIKILETVFQGKTVYSLKN